MPWSFIAKSRISVTLDEVLARHREEIQELTQGHAMRIEAVLEEQRCESEEAMRRELDKVTAAMHAIEQRERRDIHAAGQRDAVLSSARFARAAMPAVPVFSEPLDTLAHALALAPPDGMVLEFGVSGGRTLDVLARSRKGVDVYGFDSFQGLPEDWRSAVRAGAYRVETPPRIEGAEVIVGMFATTLPPFLAEHAGSVAFVHLDADLYSSTKSVLDHIGPRLRPGTVILFDEYFNYAGWEDHEHRAWQEFVSRTGIRFAYEGYTVNHEQVIVRVLDVDPQFCSTAECTSESRAEVGSDYTFSNPTPGSDSTGAPVSANGGAPS
ncbi:MAG: class I SAM-dependent methyltransferase [Actinomycetota bacterium]|nr:class I SAM-dependent methyltransferase [Actinomycetota bacterium]MDQ5807101.1 class I SAM-dependent methyltransferase [Actinomycetota bacterium]